MGYPKIMMTFSGDIYGVENFGGPRRKQCKWKVKRLQGPGDKMGTPTRDIEKVLPKKRPQFKFQTQFVSGLI